MGDWKKQNFTTPNPYLFIGCFMFLCGYGFCQPANYFFNHLNVKDGLSHSIVNALTKDAEGFLWFATYDGLNRYDGNRFVTYKSNRYDSTSLAHNSVHDVCVDKEDNIWVVTEAGVSRFNKRTGLFATYLITYDTTKLPVTPLEGVIICDREGTIWCGSAAGLSMFVPEENKFINYALPPSSVSSGISPSIGKHNMVEDKFDPLIWIATPTGIYCFNINEKIFYHEKNNPDKWSIFNTHVTYPICISPDNRIVFTDNTIHEICFYNRITNKLETTKKMVQQNQYNVSTEISTLFYDSDTNLWVSTWGYETYIMDYHSGEVTQLLHDDADPTSPSSTFAWEIMEDAEGTIWYCGVNGISYCNPGKNKYQLFHPTKYLPHIKFLNRINSIYEDENGLLWFGSLGAGLFSYDFKTNKFNNFIFETPTEKIENDHNSIYTLLPVNEELWAGTQNGIQKFNRTTGTFSRLTTIPELVITPPNLVRMMKAESDSIIWFNNTAEGLYRVNTSANTYQRWDTITVDSTPIPVTYVSFIFVDSKKRVWFSPSTQDVICYEPAKNTFRRIIADEKDSTAFPLAPTNTFVEDKYGNFWAPVKGRGIVRFNPETGKVKLWNSSDGLVWDHTLSIAQDNYGKLWISAYNLVSVFDPETNQFQNFSIEYANASFAYFNRMLTLKNGTIFCSILDAFVIFSPQKHLLNKELPPVLISNFKVFEKPVTFTQHQPAINLSYKENFFSIDYSVLTGVDPGNIQYQYQLEGFDKDWVHAGNRQYAAYTNVPGGDYIFKVRARRGKNEWSENATLINIHITKIYYQTWWFRLLLALIMFFTIRVYIRYRENQITKKSEREAINYFTHSQYTNNNADEILWDLARNVISRLDFEDCVIYLVDPVKNVLVQKAGLDNKMKDDYSINNPIEIPIGMGIVGSVAATGKPEIVGDTSKDPRYIIDDDMRLSEIAVPIIHKEKVIGVIDSEHPARNFFTKKHLELLNTIAAISAEKIVNAITRQELQEKEHRLLEYDKRVAEVRLTALRAQMNPHFIFNCMNAIDNFILKNDTDAASRYLNKFARLIRSILTESDKQYISLKDEIDILNNYIELENLRFEEKFTYHLEVDDNIDLEAIEIPPMLIQPFVENAIIHGLAHKNGDKKLSIRIHVCDQVLKCVIEDNGIGRQQAMRIRNSKTNTHESKGMRITENRFELLKQQLRESGTVKIIDLSDNLEQPSGTRVEISIPVDTE